MGGHIVYFNSNHTSGKYCTEFIDYFWELTDDDIAISVFTPMGQEMIVNDPVIKEKINFKLKENRKYG